MTNPWREYSHAEIMSMHGVEIDDPEHDTDLDQDEDDTDLEQEPSYCCSRSPCGNCMDCLGMSWSDFF